MFKCVTSVLALLAASSVQALFNVEFSDLDLEKNKRLIIYVNDASSLSDVAAQVSSKTYGQLTAAIQSADFIADFGKTQSFYGLSSFQKITLIETCGAVLSQANLQGSGGYASASTSDKGKNQYAEVTDDLNTEVSEPEVWIAMGAGLRDYHFDKYKKASSKSETRDFVL